MVAEPADYAYDELRNHRNVKIPKTIATMRMAMVFVIISIVSRIRLQDVR